MEIGIGLPTAIADVDGPAITTWAEQAEEAGFASLGAIDRLVYPGYDVMTALAVAAGRTRRVRLMTTILIAPLHTNTARLAKEAASLDRLSGGRLTLGMGLGARDDDYRASDLEPRRRGAALERQVEKMRSVWAGEEQGASGPIGPPPAQDGGPEVILGGRARAALERAARLAAGWIMGAGMPAEQFDRNRALIADLWAEAGRPGKPRTLALAYFCLGPRAAETARDYMHDYYASWRGADVADQLAAGVSTTSEAIGETIASFRECGCGELVLCPCTGDPGQVELLASAVEPETAVASSVD